MSVPDEDQDELRRRAIKLMNQIAEADAPMTPVQLDSTAAQFAEGVAEKLRKQGLRVARETKSISSSNMGVPRAEP